MAEKENAVSEKEEINSEETGKQTEEREESFSKDPEVVLETESIETQKIETEENETSSNEELEKANQQIQDLKDSWARERAEFQNYKRRTATEFANIRKEAIKGFVSKLLNPLDNLERVAGGESQSAEMKPFLDGVGMIRKEFLAILEKENIQRFSPEGEVFDPMKMEAIASEEKEGLEEEMVVEVYQSGYQFQVENEQPIIIRPSRVKVGRPINSN